MILLIQIILRKIIPRNNDLLKVTCNLKYSKNLQSQRTKDEIKTSFNFV